MTKHAVQAYDYVNRSYAIVRAALLDDPAAVFKRATRVGAHHPDPHVTELRAKIGPVEVSAEVALDITELPHEGSQFECPTTKFAIEWRALRRPELFPTMRAVLSLYPLSPTETQLDLAGTYEPPLGPLGLALDAIAMHRVAEGSIVGLVRDLASYLCDVLSCDARSSEPATLSPA